MRLVLAMLLLGLVVVTLRPGPGNAQVHVIPRRIDNHGLYLRRWGWR